jgi:hypothetical protein
MGVSEGRGWGREWGGTRTAVVVVDVTNCADATPTPAKATVSNGSRVLAGFIYLSV